MKISYISWARFDHRSQLLSHHLGATMHFIYNNKLSRVVWLPFRYLTQGLKTWQVLLDERPDLIFVQNPPIVCALLAFLYASLYRASYVIDSHTAAFLSPKWRATLGLHRVLSHKALLTIVHNEAQEEIVKKWGCKYYVLDDPLKGYPEGKSYPFKAGFNVVVISTFSEDEPLAFVFQAAKLLPDVGFYITGDSKRDPELLPAQMPGNCNLTGFLPYEEYIGLLKGSNAIMDLTTRDHTLLCGAFEAVSLEKPLITSDWKILRDHFPFGTVHIPNTVDGILDGVQQIKRNQAKFQQEMAVLREQLTKEWNLKFSRLQNMLVRS